jgi:hypothetical protein
VFLGIGVAWSLAAIYHAVKGNKFLVKPGKWVYFYGEKIKLKEFLTVSRRG